MRKKVVRLPARVGSNVSSIEKKEKKRSNPTSQFSVRRSKRIERMSNAPPGTKFMTASRQFFDIPELLDLLARTLEWPELSNLSNASYYASTVVARIIRGRVKYHMVPFLARQEDTETLFQLLRRTHSSIIGSVAWSIMTDEDLQYAKTPLTDLSIISPRGIDNVLPFVDFFRQVGYTHILCKTAFNPYRDVASRIISFQRGEYVVTITESRTGSILPVVVASPLTSMMNIVSAHRMYCMYPSLLRDRVAFISSHSMSESALHQLELRGITVKWSTTASKESCGQVCPALWRRTKGLPGVKYTVWNPFADTKFISDLPSTEDDLGYANFKWRLGFVCRNRGCPNFSPLVTTSSVLHDRLR